MPHRKTVFVEDVEQWVPSQVGTLHMMNVTFSKGKQSTPNQFIKRIQKSINWQSSEEGKLMI